MPIYEYVCNDCEHKFELLQSIGAEAAEDCPACEGKNVQKLISNSSFVLKGTGWYVTDYKDKKKNDSKSSSTTEAKPESKKSPEKATVPA
ncbi:MAG: zinc ribbon domain-containing protein [Nitrospinae bacterium]|nr:zinc ribbon domain-containing protein [Nitrospinota bacterium]